MTTAVQDIGDLRRCSVLFKDLSGAAADPTGIVVAVRDPAGTDTSYTYGSDAELERDGVGAYHIDIPAVLAGRHVVTWTTTGVPQLSESAEFHVKRKSI